MKPKIRVRSNRSARHLRIRKKIIGTSERPRLSVFRSLKHFEAQLINDLDQITLLSLSTKDKALRSASSYCGNAKSAESLGKIFACKAVEKGYSKVTFDRGGYLYHGRVKAFADAARASGLEF